MIVEMRVAERPVGWRCVGPSDYAALRRLAGGMLCSLSRATMKAVDERRSSPSVHPVRRLAMRGRALPSRPSEMTVMWHAGGAPTAGTEAVSPEEKAGGAPAIHAAGSCCVGIGIRAGDGGDGDGNVVHRVAAGGLRPDRWLPEGTAAGDIEAAAAGWCCSGGRDTCAGRSDSVAVGGESWTLGGGRGRLAPSVGVILGEAAGAAGQSDWLAEDPWLSASDARLTHELDLGMIVGVQRGEAVALENAALARPLKLDGSRASPGSAAAAATARASSLRSRVASALGSAGASSGASGEVRPEVRGVAPMVLGDGGSVARGNWVPEGAIVREAGVSATG